MNEMRIDQYKKNCELIDMIADHDKSEEISEQVLDVMCQEMELNISDLLYAYQDGDVDAMFNAITGWDLESIMAKAKVIPDTKHMFCGNTEVIPSNVVIDHFNKGGLRHEV